MTMLRLCSAVNALHSVTILCVGAVRLAQQQGDSELRVVARMGGQLVG
jgi:hypothetical protein